MKNQLKILLVFACIIVFSACKKDCPEAINGPSPNVNVTQLDTDSEVILIGKAAKKK